MVVASKAGGWRLVETRDGRVVAARTRTLEVLEDEPPPPPPRARGGAPNDRPTKRRRGNGEADVGRAVRCCRTGASGVVVLAKHGGWRVVRCDDGAEVMTRKGFLTFYEAAAMEHEHDLDETENEAAADARVDLAMDDEGLDDAPFDAGGRFDLYDERLRDDDELAVGAFHKPVPQISNDDEGDDDDDDAGGLFGSFASTHRAQNAQTPWDDFDVAAAGGPLRTRPLERSWGGVSDVSFLADGPGLLPEILV